MRIIKGTDAIEIEHPVFCLFGQPGICKSSLGYSAKDPLTLDFDGGAHRAANRRDTAAIRTWADVEDLEATLAPYSTIVVDTVGRCLDLMSLDIIDKNPKYGRDGSLTLQGFGVLKARFRAWVTHLRTMGKDLILISHHKEDKDGDTIIARPDITGSSCDEVLKISDFVGFVYMRGRDRVLDFNPTDRWFGKNPAGWKPITIPPVAKAQTFVAELVTQGREALGKISEASAGITVEVERWRLEIATFTTAEHFNRVIPSIKKLSAIVQLQVVTLLMDRAAAQHIEFDKTAKTFRQPELAGSLL